jgi:GH15 family glucan-1,4-alpha-glucosidase
MSNRIEDYAVIGNCETLALIGRDGSLDWLCLPRFDGAACFAALLDSPDRGRWLVAPQGAQSCDSRRYRDSTLILETDFKTETGAVRVIDFMLRRDGGTDIVRIVEGLSGSVQMHTELIVRFDYGSRVPWVSRVEDGRLQLTAGPDRLLLDTAVALQGEDMHTVGDFPVEAGQRVIFVLNWSPSFQDLPPPLDAEQALATVETSWSSWSSGYKRNGKYSDAVLRSLLALKALTHWQTGGIVAAGTTSLPEKLGGPRNWDYRFCWLRDATFTLYALMNSGFLEEAKAWRNWLLRAVAGSPDDLQIMYGLAGEARLTEYEVPWLSGYEGSAPVRIGNAAAGQIQLDVYGEVINMLYVARKAGLSEGEPSWNLERALVNHLSTIWQQPDDGIWEVRGGRRHFTHSKVMAWVAFDRAIRSAEEFSLEAPLDDWRRTRAAIHAQVCAQGFNAQLNSFVQAYGETALDASTLLIAMVGFLPPTDSRVTGTVAAIEKGLLRDGLVLRYDTEAGPDGLPPGEGAFLACSFWLADNYVLLGRHDDARDMFERLLSLRNDVGLLAEEYDMQGKRQLGNFPQALSHLALINTARNITNAAGPAHQRSESNSMGSGDLSPAGPGQSPGLS